LICFIRYLISSKAERPTRRLGLVTGFVRGSRSFANRQKSGEASATETKWPAAKRRELVTHLH